jgi:hypothetical protein
MSNIAMTMGLGSNDLNRPAPPATPGFTYVGASTATVNMNIQVPSGAQAGDLAIAHSSTATGPSPTVYSGFTQIASVNSTFEEMFQYKVLTSSDLTTTFTRTADNYDAAIMLVFRSGIPVTNVHVSSVNNSNQTSGTPGQQTLTTSSYDAPNLLLALYSSYSSAFPVISGTFWDGSEADAGENANKIRMYYEIQNDANTNRTVAAGGDYGSYNIMMSCVINVS